jgi:MvaI/BcnI restriction endonuclease family protein
MVKSNFSHSTRCFKFDKEIRQNRLGLSASREPKRLAIHIPGIKPTVSQGIVLNLVNDGVHFAPTGNHRRHFQPAQAKNVVTFAHKRPDIGLSPIQIFDRFGYVRKSNRDPDVMKKKLFTTVGGSRANSLGLRLQAGAKAHIEMFFHDEFICSWSLTDALRKMDQVIPVEAETSGTRNSIDERFHFVRAYPLNGLRRIGDLVTENVVVVDFCIDQILGSSQGPHDRGPHIRISRRKVSRAYHEVRTLLG